MIFIRPVNFVFFDIHGSDGHGFMIQVVGDTPVSIGCFDPLLPHPPSPVPSPLTFRALHAAFIISQPGRKDPEGLHARVPDRGTPEAQAFRRSALKFIPRVVNGGWVVRKVRSPLSCLCVFCLFCCANSFKLNLPMILSDNNHQPATKAHNTGCAAHPLCNRRSILSPPLRPPNPLPLLHTAAIRC